MYWMNHYVLRMLQVYGLDISIVWKAFCLILVTISYLNRGQNLALKRAIAKVYHKIATSLDGKIVLAEERGINVKAW